MILYSGDAEKGLDLPEHLPEKQADRAWELIRDAIVHPGFCKFPAAPGGIWA